MSESKSGKRVQSVDILKALGIMMVVLAHIDYAIAVKPWICGFVMPAFLFSSGIFLKTESGTIKSELAFCWKRFLNLMIPYFIWALIYNAIWSLSHRSFNPGSLIHILYGSHQSLGKVHTLTSLWFLPMLFLATVLFSLCRLLFKDKLNPAVKLILAGVFFVIGGVLPKLSYGYPWGVNLVPTAFGFIMLGNVVYPFLKNMRQKPNGKWGPAILIVGTVVCFAGTLLYRFNIPKNGYINMANAAYGNYLLFLPIAFIGVAFMLFLSLTLDWMIPEKPATIRNFFSFFGRTTMCTYLTHKLFIRLFEAFFKVVHAPNIVMAIVTSVGTIALCYLAALLISRFMPILIGQIPNKNSKQQKKG